MILVESRLAGTGHGRELAHTVDPDQDFSSRRSDAPTGIGPASPGGRPERLGLSVREIPAASRQPQHGAYGRRLGKCFGIDHLPCIVTRTLRRAELAVMEVRIDRPAGGGCDPMPYEDAFSVSLALRDLPANACWEEGRQVSQRTIQAGESLIHDLRRSPMIRVDEPMHLLLLHLPRTALDALAEAANVPRVGALHYAPGAGIADETVRNIGLSLLPAVRAPEQASRLFTDHLILGLGAHVAQTYGGMEARSRPIQGGLAPWQEKRSKDMLAGDLAGTTSLFDIAAACGLSISHFSRAFRRSTGLAPHAWLLHARVEAAKAMLRQREAPLSTIALACGFADQSHFTRVFSRRVGLSPGAWRKYLAE
jgi:AraC-like DNA-binding protein